MENLISDRDNLELSEEFIDDVKKELARFKQEVRFREDEEQAKKDAEEERKKKKAAAKKK